MPYKRFKKAYASKAVKKYIRKAIKNQAEKKFAFSTGVIPGTGATNAWQHQQVVAQLSIAQGTTASTRVGSKIRAVKLEFFVRIDPVASTTGKNGSFCRFIFWKSKDGNGIVATTTEIFDSDNILTSMNSNYKHRFTKLGDFTHQMVVTSASDAGVNISSGPMFFKTITFYPKDVIEFGSLSTGVQANIIGTDFGISWICDDANCCLLYVGAKLTYVDS